ncbi:hypothetical protein [Streptomyces platensis]|uniref:hypothetical protein n=1 Tax=Streptomyces platensis TaxID=58346 RepID=UPI002E0EEFC7|nr:hypothetical protein OG229_34250 [Streptomyces platensis]
MNQRLAALLEPAGFGNVLAAAAAAAVTVLGILIQDWRSRRSRLDRRKMMFEDAARQVAFVTAWWQAMEALSPQPDHHAAAKARGLAWLDEASALVAEAKEAPTARRAPLSPKSVLLFYRFERLSAQAIRLCYYGVLVWAAVTVATIPSDAGTEYFVTDFFVVAGYVFIALLLRTWAIRAERSPRRDAEPAQTAPGSQPRWEKR